MFAILVTGGAGFIGSHSVNKLLQQGQHVIVLDNLSSGAVANLDLNHPHLKFIEGDILNFPLVQKILKECKAVLHLAAIASVQQTIQNPISSLQTNTQGFLHLLEGIRLSNRSLRIVYASSAAVYGDATVLPCSDETPTTYAPLSPYALEKLQNEYYADLYQRLHHVPSLGLRYFNVYGPKQNPQSPYSGVISRFRHHYQHQQPILIYGDGQQSRDFIYVTDVAQANYLALEATASGVVNIATGIPETLQRLIHYLEKAGSHPAHCEFAPKRAGDILHSYATIEKAKKLIQFENKIALEEGIKLLFLS